MSSPQLSVFACDITPPMGHPLCGGWIEPARSVADPLRALGVILLGRGRPVVLCALDWCGVRNEANIAWRQALAEAVGTVAENVALHCVHPHDAPFADVDAERLLEAVPGAPHSLDLKFFQHIVHQTAEAARTALSRSVPFTHLGLGKAKVEKVASNRRVLGPDGKIRYWRGSSTKDKAAQAEPEGLIDPWLKTLSFWNGTRPLAALSYYATHPMSHYGQGQVSADFCGLARQKRQEEDPGVFQVYFTGCAGNIAAGKYNDGSPGNRAVLRDRMYMAMKAAWKSTNRFPVNAFDWRTQAVRLPPRRERTFGQEASRLVLNNARESKARRGNAAFQIAWLDRQQMPITLSCLDFGRAAVVHLPGEPFIEYQLKAQQLRPKEFICVAGYGDGGPGYIPTADAYFQGGYETTVALAGPESQRVLEQALGKLLRVD